MFRRLLSALLCPVLCLAAATAPAESLTYEEDDLLIEDVETSRSTRD